MQMLTRTRKKGQAIASIFIAGVGGVIAFGVLVIALSLIGQVLATQQATQTTNSIAFNVTGSGLTGTANIGDLVPTMGLVFGIVLVLGLLVGLLVLFSGGRFRGE